MAKTQVERTRKHTEDYREWIKNGSPRQKELWEMERKLQNKPHKRSDYMAVTNELLTFLPPSNGNGGKYGRPEPLNHDEYGEEKGVTVHLRRRF